VRSCRRPQYLPSAPRVPFHVATRPRLPSCSYVYIALKGYSYCEAVGKVFRLLVEYTSLLLFVNILSACGTHRPLPLPAPPHLPSSPCRLQARS
jgi:hypothetical protein